MTAGYSGTPLPRKLGIRPGDVVLVLGDPLALHLALIGAPVHRVPDGKYPVVLLFCPDVAALAEQFDTAKAAQSATGAIWVCWPKKSSGVSTDLTEGAVREFGLVNGRVDVKVAAIDSTWSGLKFVTRRADRGQIR